MIECTATFIKFVTLEYTRACYDNRLMRYITPDMITCCFNAPPQPFSVTNNNSTSFTMKKICGTKYYGFSNRTQKKPQTLVLKYEYKSGQPRYYILLIRDWN